MLSIVSDLAKYTRANNHGDLIFSKTGLQGDKPVFKLTLKRSGFFLTIPGTSSFVRLRFTSSVITWQCNILDGSSANAPFSQHNTADNYGIFYIDSAGSEFEAYAFLQFLRGSNLSNYYHIEYQELNNDEFTLFFTGKVSSSDYHLAIDSTTVSPFVWSYYTTFYRASQVNYSPVAFPEYQLHIRILVEDSDRRERFTEVYTTFQTVGEIQEDGRTLFYFKNIPFVLRQYLSFNPIENIFRILVERDLYRKFRIEYWESWYVLGARRVSTSPKSFDVATKYAALSAIDERSLHCEDIKLLNNTGSKQYLAPHQPAWFSFFIPEEMVSGMEQLSFIVRDNLGNTIQTLDVNTLLYLSNVYHIPVCYRNDTEDVDWIEAEVEYYGSPGGNPEVRFVKKRFYIDRKYNPIDKWYYYVNSLGGIDSIRLFGESEDMLSYTYGDYEEVRKAGEFLSQGSSQRFASWSRHKTKGYSGWIERDFVAQFKDFLYSRHIFEVDTKKLPTATTLPYFPMRYSIRHTLEQIISHKVLISTKDLTIPKGVDLPSFQINIDRAYNDRGILHPATCANLPMLQEDFIDIVFQFDTVFTGVANLAIIGEMANLSVNANGNTDSQYASPSPPNFGKEFMSGNADFFINYVQTNTAHIRIKANYTKKMHLILTLPISTAGKIYIHNSRFVELEEFSIYVNDINPWQLYGAKDFYLKNWTTLKKVNLARLNDERALDLLLAVLNYRNTGVFSGSFDTVDLTNGPFGSGITPVPGSPLARSITALAAQSVNVIL